LGLIAPARLIASVRATAMSVRSEQFEVRTRGKGTYEITDQVRQVVKQSGIATGTVTVFVQHTSCSLVIMENAAPAARRDLEKFFERFVPEDADYEHDDEGPDDSTSHIRMALTRTSEVIPLSDSRMQLGTWQGIFLFEHRRAAHTRKIVVTVMGE
jgi:secondary thiamine-phosphate synthase enzyme